MCISDEYSGASMTDEARRIANYFKDHFDLGSLSNSEPEEALPCAAALIEKLAAENEEMRTTRDTLSERYGRMMARCEAAERDLNSLLSLCGLQCYEACRFCALPDDETCVAGAPKERCNAVWRGPNNEGE